jgi:hypothetical protein
LSRVDLCLGTPIVPAQGALPFVHAPITSDVRPRIQAKADKANRQPQSDGSARDAVIELEQAGDSAKAAVEADPNLSREAFQAVQDAHLAICILKTEV